MNGSCSQHDKDLAIEAAPYTLQQSTIRYTWAQQRNNPDAATRPESGQALRERSKSLRSFMSGSAAKKRLLR